MGHSQPDWEMTSGKAAGRGETGERRGRRAWRSKAGRAADHSQPDRDDEQRGSDGALDGVGGRLGPHVHLLDAVVGAYLGLRECGEVWNLNVEGSLMR